MEINQEIYTTLFSILTSIDPKYSHSIWHFSGGYETLTWITWVLKHFFVSIATVSNTAKCFSRTFVLSHNRHIENCEKSRFQSMFSVLATKNWKVAWIFLSYISTRKLRKITKEAERVPVLTFAELLQCFALQNNGTK